MIAMPKLLPCLLASLALGTALQAWAQIPSLEALPPLPSSVLARMLFVIVTQLIVGTKYVRKGPPVSR